MIRKGQARRVSGSDGRRQIQFINKLFGVEIARVTADAAYDTVAFYEAAG